MNAKDLGRFALALVLLAVAPRLARADAVPGKALKLALQRYKDALAKVRWTPRDGTIAGLYERAVDFGLATDPGLPAELSDFLEHASPAQSAALKEDLEGLIVIADPLAVTPDARWFLAVARKGEAPESTAFFELLVRVRPAGAPAPFLAEGGCVAFGGGTLVDLYGRLAKGASEWPRYRRFATAEAARIADVLATASCVCGEAPSVERELRQFLKGFPKDPGAGPVAARLEALRAGTSDLRFRCSGTAGR